MRRTTSLGFPGPVGPKPQCFSVPGICHMQQLAGDDNLDIEWVARRLQDPRMCSCFFFTASFCTAPSLLLSPLRLFCSCPCLVVVYTVLVLAVALRVLVGRVFLSMFGSCTFFFFSVECYGTVPWDPMRLSHGIPRDAMGARGIPWGPVR